MTAPLIHSRINQTQRGGRVALVNMPFASAAGPSIQCGLLKACVERSGHTAQVHYLNLELASVIGPRLYSKIVDSEPYLLLGEWLFSPVAFERWAPEQDYSTVCGATLAEFCSSNDVSFSDLCALRKEVLPPFIERWSAEVDWGQYDVVGFSSLFEQNTPGLALARAIKRRHPEVVIVFGGANFDGDMGAAYLKGVPWIDYAVVGEGDYVFPDLIHRLVNDGDPLDLPGVVGRVSNDVVMRHAPRLVQDMDALPDPDYQEYFQTLDRLGRTRIIEGPRVNLPFESARGCWWGQKHHCTFCGLNASTMSFRSKSATSTLAQLDRLAAKHRVLDFSAVDDIMAQGYLGEFCRSLAESAFDYRLFYETKSNLKRSQLRALARAGIRDVQPGIESLSTKHLKAMRKGVTLLQNVRFLKWATYYGIGVGWNILTGFPGETDEDFREMERIVPFLRHLPPPHGCGRFRLERFSPYFHDDSLPVENIAPLKVYSLVYPENQIDLPEIAYFFDYSVPGALPDSAYAPLKQLCAEWRKSWWPGESSSDLPALGYAKGPGWLTITDDRTPDRSVHEVYGLGAEIYEFCCETGRTLKTIHQHVGESARKQVPAAEITSELEQFCDAGLMLREGDSFLSLGLPTARDQ